ncbi:3'-5' exonuclease [Helicobacter cetorum]|uniref:DNA polymerase III subunit epsilon n=1 Tax=Helicobacter cetorum (strain ATCC BAA-540 / CCUG 52418 / MIT 99-5656) TaxID=1163745 RepID=I0ESM7_HELCM|nr:3'-5' exonuclease [Helicobacter cetorum]AFI05946.1 DNA polymerase III subunit epsilon [Helicobacter cetorum MIT 99-5656]
MLENLLHKDIQVLIARLKHQDISLSTLESLLSRLVCDEINLEYLKACGLNFMETNDNLITLKNLKTPLKDEVFSFIDLETTGSCPLKHEILEIGAVQVQGGQIINRFETFIKVKSVPDYITELTGIAYEDTLNAPNIKEVLQELRLFLGNSVFVAHNANFDYAFLERYFVEKLHSPLLNLKLCTLDLARRSILSMRYSLSFLKELLGFDIEISHRAYADALASYRLFEVCLLNLPSYIKTTIDLIDFSCCAKTLIKRPPRAFKNSQSSKSFPLFERVQDFSRPKPTTSPLELALF